MQIANIKIATTQYQLDELANWSAYENKIESLIKSAKDQQVNLLLLPEYAGLELTHRKSDNLLEQFNHLQSLLEQYIHLYQSLAKRYHIYIQPGSLPVKNTENIFYNRAFIFSPDGNYAYQDKIQLTQFERVSTLIVSGNSLQVFDTTFGKIAIAICYDAEFPLLVNQLVTAGANLILVPSCTDSLWGHHRVHLSCRARALENQCFVVQASLVGKYSSSEFVDINVGQAGIFSPVDQGFPNDGVIALGKLNDVQMVVGELNFSQLEIVRNQGQVRNFEDMQYYQSSLYKNIIVNINKL